MESVLFWLLVGALGLLLAAAAQRNWQRLSESRQKAARANWVWVALTVGLYVAFILTRLMDWPLQPHT